jgi:hypothetical protein
MEWASECMTQTNNLKDELESDLCDIVDDFKDEVRTDKDSTVKWL